MSLKLKYMDGLWFVNSNALEFIFQPDKDKRDAILTQLYCLGSTNVEVRVVSEEYYQTTRKLLKEDQMHLDQYDEAYNPHRQTQEAPTACLADLEAQYLYSKSKGGDHCSKYS